VIFRKPLAVSKPISAIQNEQETVLTRYEGYAAVRLRSPL
jgi:hypothetical protein